MLHTGVPAPEVKWYKGDDKLKPKNDSRITLDFDVKLDLHILTINDTLRSDEGLYKLKVVNQEGSISVSILVTYVEDSQKVTKVEKREDKVTKEEAVTVLKEEEQTSITVTEKQELEESEHVKDQTEVREITSEEFSKAPCKPVIDIAPEPVIFTEGESIILSCRVSGQQRMEIAFSLLTKYKMDTA